MPDPISSFSPSANPNACNAEASDPGAVCSAPPQAPSSAAPPLMSVPDEPGVCMTPNGVKALVERFSPATAAKASVSGLPAHTLALLSKTSGPSAAGGSQRVAFTGLKAQVDSGPLGGTGIEVAGASMQFGSDTDLQFAAGRQTDAVSHAGYGLSLTGEVVAGRLNLGEHNDDGSLGGNIGAGLDLAGAELTLSTPVGSLTGGVSVSLSASGSLGVRDADHDGKPEFCAKFSVPAFTLGACVEQFW